MSYSGLALTSGKQDLIVDPPIMNSAGILGFTPDAKIPYDPSTLGAFVTHPISLKRRVPASPPRFEEYPGGILIHSGLPNPGIKGALKTYRKTWEGFSKPIILHLICDHAGEMAGIVERLEDEEDVIQGLEVGFETPSTDHVVSILSEASQSQLPLLTRFPLGTGLNVLSAAVEAGVNALVVGPPRGSVEIDDGERISGRLYGPGLFPHALQQIDTLSRIFELPVILGCGLYTGKNLRAAIDAGAVAVQLDTVLWVDPSKLFDEWKLG